MQENTNSQKTNRHAGGSGSPETFAIPMFWICVGIAFVVAWLRNARRWCRQWPKVN